MIKNPETPIRDLAVTTLQGWRDAGGVQVRHVYRVYRQTSRLQFCSSSSIICGGMAPNWAVARPKIAISTNVSAWFRLIRALMNNCYHSESIARKVESLSCSFNFRCLKRKNEYFDVWWGALKKINDRLLLTCIRFICFYKALKCKYVCKWVYLYSEKTDTFRILYKQHWKMK